MDINVSRRSTFESRRTNVSTIAHVAYAVLVIGLALALLVPWLPEFPQSGLDYSWIWAMNEMVTRHVGFNSDLFFTYGPYASAYTRQYGPTTGGMMLFATILCTVALMAGFLALSSRWRLWVVVLVPMVASINAIRDARFLLIPFLLVTLIYRLTLPKEHHSALALNIARRVAIVILLLACAMLPLIKISFSTSVLGFSIPAVIIAFRRSRSAAVFGVAFVVAFLLIFWVAAGQSILNLWSYWRAQMPLVSGFSDAMSIAGPPAEIVAYVACAGALLWLELADSWKTWKSLPYVLWFLSLAYLLFTAFKAGFMRHDHVFIAMMVLQLAGIVIFLQARLSIAVPAFFLAMGCCLAVATTSRGDTLEGQWRQVRNNLGRTHLGLLLRSKPGTLDSLYRQAVQKIVTESPIKPSSGTNDIYPFDQSLLLASGAPWSPRPALQGYETYTPSIQRLDADHLRSASAASVIFYSISTIDLQYPSLQDGLSWPNLFSYYRFKEFQGDYAVLSRSASPSAVTFEPESSSIRALGESVSVPPTNIATWAKIKIRKTLLGKLASLLFKAPDLAINVALADGRFQTFKYVQGMGEEGFFLSPLVTTTLQFVAMKSKYPEIMSKDRVISFTLTTSSYWDWIWRKQYSLSLSSVHIEPDTAIDAALVGQMKPLNIDLSAARQAQCYFDSVDDKPAGGDTVQSDGLVFLNGWSAIDPVKGLASDDAFLLVDSAKGRYIAHINQTERPDVGIAYKHPEMKTTGFHQAFDLRSLPGNSRLSILQIKDGKPYVCPGSVSLNVALR